MDFLQGTVTSAVSVTAQAPFERVKLLLQCQDELIRSERLSEPYKGLADCFAREVRREGIVSLWRGYVACLIHYYLNQALNRAFKNCFNRLLSLKKDKDGYWKRFAETMESLGGSGVCALFFVYPLDFARTRLTNDIRAGKNGGQRQFSGLVDVYKKTLKSDGVAGLYRGFGIACSAMLLSWAFKEYSQRQAKKIRDSQPNFLAFMKNNNDFLADFVEAYAVCMSDLASYPADTVQRRMMMTSGEAVKDRSSLHALQRIIRKEGIGSLFKGVPSNILRWIAGAAAMTAYEKRLLLLPRVFPRKPPSIKGK